MIARVIHVLLSLLAVTGCDTLSTTRRPPEYFALTAASATGSNASLFAADAEVLEDAEIERILAYEYTPPGLSRVALLPFGWGTWSGWSEEMAVAAAAVDMQVLQTLRNSPRIYDASFLPSMLVPERKTVPYLREAAARYQADLLLTFRSSCESFARYRLFRSEQTRAYCTVEAVLLDVRTGLVPFVASAREDFDASETRSDFNFRETILRGQLNALGAALGDVALAVVRFVERTG